MDIPQESYKIPYEIESGQSPVRIDANKTPILILHQRERIEAALERDA